MNVIHSASAPFPHTDPSSLSLCRSLEASFPREGSHFSLLNTLRSRVVAVARIDSAGIEPTLGEGACTLCRCRCAIEMRMLPGRLHRGTAFLDG